MHQICRARRDHIQALRVLLISFKAIAGLKVSLAKLEVVLMGNVPNMENMASTLGCKISHLPMKHLGFPFECSIKIETN